MKYLLDMEISLVKDSSLKIKTKNATVITNPVVKGVSDIVILSVDDDRFDAQKIDEAKLIIHGAGEYELGGVRITGHDIKPNVMYELSSDSEKILLISASALSNLKEEDEYTAMVILADAKVMDAGFESFPSSIFILYGDEKNIALSQNLRKLPKVNLKKREDLTNSVVFLSPS